MKAKTNTLVLLMLLTAASCDKLQFDRSGSIKCTASIENSFLTRGVQIDQDSLNKKDHIFIMDALLETANRNTDLEAHYLKRVEMKYTNDCWENENCKWTDLVWTNFWAVYPDTVTGRGRLKWTASDSTALSDADEKVPTFDYDMTGYIGNMHAADSTQDMLVAYSRGRRNVDEGTGTDLNFKFRHALSGICFKRGHIDPGYNITQVSISGLHLKGTCSLTGSTASLKDSLAIAWTGTDTPADTDSLTQMVNAVSVAENQFITGSNMIFVIPQTMSSTTSITAVVQDTTAGTFETRSVALVGYSWKPGKRYAYTLSFYKDLNELVISVDEYNITKNGTWTD